MHWTHGSQEPIVRSRRLTMRANDLRSTEAIRHGAYVCFNVPPSSRRLVATAGADVAALARRLGLRNEFEPGDGHPPEAIAFLRRVGATPAQIADPTLERADAVVHVASATSEPVAEFCAEAKRLLGPSITPSVLAGIVRPMMYTGSAMHNFAYGHRVLQESGTVMPNAFLLPMSKSAAW